MHEVRERENEKFWIVSFSFLLSNLYSSLGIRVGFGFLLFPLFAFCLATLIYPAVFVEIWGWVGVTVGVLLLLLLLHLQT